MKRIFFICFFLSLLCPFSVSAQNITEILAQKKRTDDLLTLLGQLQQRINSLPDRLPTVSGPFQLTGTGADAGYNATSFGTLDPSDPPRDATVTLKNTTGKPAEFVGIRDLSAPFFFKGGTYPGQGGTCRQPLIAPGDCTLVFRYAPTGSSQGTSMGGVTRHQTQVKLDVIPDGDWEASTAYFTLTGYRTEETNPASVLDDFTVQMEKAPEPTIIGQSSNFTLRVGLKDPNDKRMIVFKNVTVSGLTAPFSLDKNLCAEQPLNIGACNINGFFRPLTEGAFEKTITVNVNFGEETSRSFTVTLSGQESLSDQLAVPDPGKNILVVYNEDWVESVEVKNYYLANRPGFGAVNILGIHLPVSPSCSGLYCLSQALEAVPYDSIRTRVSDPIVSWLRSHSDKDIQYIVLMRGLPIRPTDVALDQGSVQWIIHEAATQISGKEVFISSLDMGSLGATKAYIDKLKSMYGRMTYPSLVISSAGTGKEGTAYYFEDSGTKYPDSFRSAGSIKNAVTGGSVAARVNYRGPSQTHFSSASDVLGYVTWGDNANWGGDYMLNGSIQFSGNSNWYLIQTFESYNGAWVAGANASLGQHFQGNFIKWFSRAAFGGTNYEYTPVAAVTHVHEPSLGGTNDASLFACWDRGKLFSYCAWNSRATHLFQAIGDPLITK